MGTTVFSNLGPTGVNPTQSLGQALGGQQGMLGSPYQQMNSAAVYNSMMAQQRYNANRQTYDWVWNGKPVSITEFADLAYGDTPQRSIFLLKHSDKK